jgi:UDPglucose 6-dehydrogenase
MRIAIIGCGYVGLTTAACLAEVGNHVLAMDADEQRIRSLLDGKMPIYEPGLKKLIKDNLVAGRIEFTHSLTCSVANADIVIIAVGTPVADDGSADLSAVRAVADSLANQVRKNALLVLKSTVPAGTTYALMAQVNQLRESVGNPPLADVAFNPEFLKEGTALADFQRPDRIIIGVETQRAEQLLRRLYAPFNRNHEKLLVMDIASAELSKYAANAMLATRISFMNEMAAIADAVGADIEQVRIGIGSDQRIGYPFLYAGAGFGGSCFPKDLSALQFVAKQASVDARILQATQDVNREQKTRPFKLLMQHFDDDLRGRRVAVWGLAFKPGTDDIRAAPARVLMEALWEQGACVQAYDPKAMAPIRSAYQYQVRSRQLQLMRDPYKALENADAVVLLTEWKCFWSPDFQRMASLLKHPVLIDGRNVFDPQEVAEAGLMHYAIGRGLWQQSRRSATLTFLRHQLIA